MSEHVTKREPVLLDQDDETFESTVIRIQAKLTQSAQLAGPVPAVAAVNQDMAMLKANLSCNQSRAIEHVHYVLQPAALL
jgi:hypothetical protein